MMPRTKTWWEGQLNAVEKVLGKAEIGDCWVSGHPTNQHGYAQVTITGGGAKKKAYAHRLVYEVLVGPIPEGLTIDHLCRVRNCVNPDHLEPVSHAENVRRGTSHRCGHDDWFIEVDGIRRCRPCRNERARKYRERVKERTR